MSFEKDNGEPEGVADNAACGSDNCADYQYMVNCVNQGDISLPPKMIRIIIAWVYRVYRMF